MKNNYYYVLFVLVILTFLPITCKAYGLQDGQDTVFIYLDPAVSKAREIGRTTYYKPEISYPKDISRIYFIHTYSHKVVTGDSTRVNAGEFLLSMSPTEGGPDFFYESPEAFFKRDYLDQSWFEKSSGYEIIEKLEDKVIYVVDPNYVYEGKFYVVKVHFSSSVP
jgi:hypothetical protein